MNLRAALCAVAACASVSCAYVADDGAATAGTPANIGEPAKTVIDDERVAELLSTYDVPGLSYAVLRGCELVETGTAGLAIVEDDVRVGPNTAFEAASLSKPVFAWLVMSLAEQGIVDLDEPFARSGFAYPRIEDAGRYAELTPRLVLMHRTGLPNWAGDTYDLDRTDRIAFVGEPGGAHSYSGEAYQLLQAFIEEKTQKPLETLFRERLGQFMPHSTFRRPLPPDAMASRGYKSAADPMSGRAMTALRPRGIAAFSLATTATDYAGFVSLLCRGEGLKPATYDDMLIPQTGAMPAGDSASERWVLGWQVLAIKGREAIMHTGDNGEYMALAVFFPDNGEGYVVLTNGTAGLDLSMKMLREAGAGETR